MRKSWSQFAFEENRRNGKGCNCSGHCNHDCKDCGRGDCEHCPKRGTPECCKYKEHSK